MFQIKLLRLLVFSLFVTEIYGVRKILINDVLAKKGHFPVYDTVTSPVLYCYQAVNRFSLEGFQKPWSGLEITLIDFSELVIVVGNSTRGTEKLLNSASRYDSVKKKFLIVFSPYDNVCVGATRLSEYDRVAVTLDYKSRVLLHLPVMMIVGLFLFFMAYSLSRSLTLYYGGGMILGIVASVIILLYIISKFVPKKNILGLGLFAGGWALFVAAVYWVLEHIMETVQDYWVYLMGYVIVAAVVSFALLYRMGPISNERTFNLIQWSIQIVGLGLVYFSTQMWELSLSLCVLVILFYMVPARYNPLLAPIRMVFSILYYVFYPVIVCLRCLSFLNPFSWFTSTLRVKLLTEEEYKEQGRVETEKALSNLRKYCQELPTKKMVNVMSKLKNSNRFSEFLVGRDHISQEEQVSHDWAHIDTDSSDEETDKERFSSSHHSSMDSLQYSFTDSPTRHHPPSPYRRLHPSPGRSEYSGHFPSQRSQHHMQYRSPREPPSFYHTSY